MKSKTLATGIIFESEPKDTAKDIVLKDNLNKLLESLRWFHERGLKIAVKWNPDGYTFHISK
jgi:hypothetical protein